MKGIWKDVYKEDRAGREIRGKVKNARTRCCKGRNEERQGEGRGERTKREDRSKTEVRRPPIRVKTWSNMSFVCAPFGAAP